MPAESTSSINRRIVQAAGIVMVSVLLSRILAFFRDWTVAHQIGSNAITDAYYAAFTLPDFLNYLVAGGSLSLTFIPILTRCIAEKRDKDGWRVFSTAITFMGILLVAGIILGELFAPQLVRVIAPGFHGSERQRVVFLTRLMLPAQICFYLGGILSAVQYAKGQFALPSLAPVVYNTGIILGGVLLSSRIGITGFAVGVLAGAFGGNFLLQIYGARRAGAEFHPNLDLRNPDFKLFIKLTIPIMLALSIVFTDDWIIRWFGSYLAPALLGRKIRGAESNPQCHAQGRDSVAAAGFGTGDCAEDATGLSRLLAHPYACGGPSRHGCDAGNVFNRYVCLGRAKHPFTRVLCSPRYLDPCNRRYCDDFSELAGLLDTLAAFAAPGPGIGQFHWRYCLHGDPFHPAEPPDSQCRCSQASGILLESLCGFRTGRMGVLRSDETVGTAYPLALGSRCPGSPHRGKHGGLAPDRARCQVASCPRAGTLFEKIEARVSNARTSLRRLKSSAGLVPQRRFAPGTHLAVHF